MSDTRLTEWLSLKDIQRLLGIGRTKAYELVTTGELPAIKVGRCIRVSREEFNRWLESRHYLDVRREVV